MFYNSYGAFAGDVYVVVYVLCIHNLVCGDVVDPQSGLWRCGGNVVKV